MASIFLCLSYSNHKLGAAYYEEDTTEVKILSDTSEDANHYFLLKNLLKVAKPNQIILNKSQDKAFIREVCRLCNYAIPADIDNISSSFSNVSKSFMGQTEALSTQNFSETCNNAKKSPNQTINSTTIPNTAQIFNKIDENNLSNTIIQNENDQSNLNSKSPTHIPKFPVGSNANLPKFPVGNNANLPKFPSKSKVINEKIIDDTISNEQQIIDLNNNKEEEKIFDDDVFSPILNFFPNIAFSFGEAKKRLENVFNDNIHDSKLLTAFRFDYTAFNMIRALGALLRFLDQQRIGVEFESYEVKTPIKLIKTIYLNDILEIDETTSMALEIFHSNYNPASIRRKFVFGNARKEGASLFSLCNICRSTPGKLLLRYWFDCPTTSHEILQQRHEAISFFYHDCNLDAGRFIRNMLKDVMSVRGIFNRMNVGNITINDWKNLYLTICALVKIGEYVSEREIKLKILKDKMQFFGDDLVRLANVFNEIIDFRESLSESRFVINAGVDPKLDELKETYDQLPEMLTNIAQAEAEELCVESCSVAYIPIIGYLLVIPEAYKVPGNTMIQLIFSAEGMLHFKSRRMQNLDEKIGDIKMQIIDMETTINLRLQSMVLKRASVVLKALEAAAILDCVLSLAVVARDYNWIRPKFVTEKILDITNARHPVAELLCKNAVYVSNPITSNKECGKVKILSGPNASGKSVYLKMVGVIVYLAHVGSFVPAEKAIIGPINRIMSRMYTIDSVLDGMSSFANDLKQMSNAIRRSDGCSLLIIDEFGKGTATEVGLSLLASCLNYWLEKESDDLIPHLFISSHFHALRNFIISSDMVSYKTMDVIRKENDSLEFQFRLVDGVIDNSYASVTALNRNIPSHVVERADEIYLHLRVGSSLAELPIRDKKKEEEYLELGKRMESLIDSFCMWDMDADPRGFLNFAQEVLLGESNVNEKETIESDEKNKTISKHSASIDLTNNNVLNHADTFKEIEKQEVLPLPKNFTNSLFNLNKNLSQTNLTTLENEQNLLSTAVDLESDIVESQNNKNFLFTLPENVEDNIKREE